MIEDIVQYYDSTLDLLSPYSSYSTLISTSKYFEDLRKEAIERNIFTESEIDSSPLVFYVVYSLLKLKLRRIKKGQTLSSLFAEIVYEIKYNEKKDIPVVSIPAEVLLEIMTQADKLCVDKFYIDFMFEYRFYNLFLLLQINKCRLDMIANNKYIDANMLNSRIDILFMDDEEFNTKVVNIPTYKEFNKSYISLNKSIRIIGNVLLIDDDNTVYTLNNITNLTIKEIGKLSWNNVGDIYVNIELVEDVIIVKDLEGVNLQFNDKAYVYLYRTSCKLKPVIYDSRITLLNNNVYGIDDLYIFKSSILGVDINGETYLNFPEEYGVEIIDTFISKEIYNKLKPYVFRGDNNEIDIC